MKTLVNTATIQRIHSTTKYHEAKVTTTKNKRYMYILFQKSPNWETEQTFAPFAQPPRRNQPCHQLCCTITKLIHVLILLFTENTPTGKTRKTFAPFAGHPETPDFTSTWLDNNGITHVSIYFQAHQTQALQLAITYQCCIQAQSWPNISNKCLWYWWTTSQYKRSTITSFQHQCLTNTNSASQQTCGAWSYSNLLQIETRISDQQIW